MVVVGAVYLRGGQIVEMIFAPTHVMNDWGTVMTPEVVLVRRISVQKMHATSYRALNLRDSQARASTSIYMV